MEKKYIDADKLKSILKERYNTYKIGQHSPFRSGKVETLRETIELIDSLQQEQSSIPSNLDEAVAKYIESQTPADQGEEMIIYNAFKAGAGWQEKQKEQTFESVWHKEECQRIIDEGQGLTPRFKDLFKEVCKAFYETGAGWHAQQEQESVAERFARIVRGNLIGIDKEVQQKFEQLYFEVTGNKMYGGYND